MRTTENEIENETVDETQQETLQEISSEMSQTEEYQQIKTEIRVTFYQTMQLQIKERPPLRKIGNFKNLENNIKIASKIVEELTAEEEFDLIKFNQLIYATANVKTNKIEDARQRNRQRTNKDEEPPWAKRINSKVNMFGKELSVLTEVNKGTMRKIAKNARNVLGKYRLRDQNMIVTKIENLKQKVLALTQRRKRYTKRTAQYKQNRMYNTNPKKLYRQMRQTQIQVNEPPEKHELDKFWRKIYEEQVVHKQNAEWIQRWENNNVGMDWQRITEQEIRNYLKKAQNWKTAGIDEIPNFWLKTLTATYKSLAKCFNDLTNEGSIPEWLTEGITFLIPKNQETTNAKKYRPITCLTTTYKLLTGMLSERLQKYIMENDLIPVEQKGCFPGTKGCKEQLLASKAIMEDCKHHRKDLSVAWIDYKKAFDSVPHSWIIKSLELIGANEKSVNFCKASMLTWKTTMKLKTTRGTSEIKDVRIKRGIFQGDSFSPLEFCVSLIPLTKLLNQYGMGYKKEGNVKTLAHLLYMDDLKLIAKSKQELKKQLELVREFSNDIKIEFRYEKCAKITIEKGRPVKSESIRLELSEEIKELENGAIYKYLGVEENYTSQHQNMKRRLEKEYYHRVRAILKTELNSRNKIKAIGEFAVPVLQYSFGIINWKIDEVKRIDVKTRKLLNMNSAHHPKADLDRLYVSRKEGGRGLRQVEGAYTAAIINLQNYLEKNAHKDPVVKLIAAHDKKSYVQ